MNEFSLRKYVIAYKNILKNDNSHLGSNEIKVIVPNDHERESVNNELFIKTSKSK